MAAAMHVQTAGVAAEFVELRKNVASSPSSLAGVRMVAAPKDRLRQTRAWTVSASLYSDAKHDSNNFKFDPIKESIVARLMTRR
uniref:Uncharacterized protein n=1 Tax=Physcomitrium patens TaxID=3218 RepID=A0A7I3ZN47_PHYPA